MDTTPEPECKCVHECIQNADGRLRWSYSKADSEVTDGNYCVQYANAECTVLGDTTEEPCTPVDSCICELPDFCPEEDGACTYTRCLSNYGLKGPKIMEECDPASTTTSSTTTTETPCGECTWECGSAEWLPRWVLISENCCEGGDCEDLEGQSCPDYGEFTQTNCTTSTTQGPTTTTTTENVNCCVLEDDSYVLKQVSRLECCRLGGRVVADEQECDDTPTTPECDDTLYACLNSEKTTECKYRPVWDGTFIRWILIDGCAGTDGRYYRVPCSDKPCYYRCACTRPSDFEPDTTYDICTSTLCCDYKGGGTCVMEVYCPPCPPKLECKGKCDWYWDGCLCSWFFLGNYCPRWQDVYPPGIEIPPHCWNEFDYYDCYCDAPKPIGKINDDGDCTACANRCKSTGCRERTTEPPDEPVPEPPTDPSNPCEDPEQPTTTTTKGPTTEGPCDKECVYAAIDNPDAQSSEPYIWSKVRDDCDAEAETCDKCGTPLVSPIDSCEEIKVKCGEGDTTTTTTTTAGPCTGECQWEVAGDNRWYLVESDCSEGCNCPSDSIAGELGPTGANFIENCGDEPEEPGRYCFYEGNKVLIGCVTSYRATGSNCDSGCLPKGTCCEDGICTEEVFRADCSGRWKQYIA